jgi:hypothetical protein
MRRSDQICASNPDGSLFDNVLFSNSGTGRIAFVDMNAGGAGGFVTVLGALPAGWRPFSTGDSRADAFAQDTNMGAFYHVSVASGVPVCGLVSTSLASAYQAVAAGAVTRGGT